MKPERAELTAGGVRFRMRVPVSGEQYAGCFGSSLLGFVLGAVAAAVVLSLRHLLGGDLPVLDLVMYLPILLGLCGMLAVPMLFTTDRTLSIEGRGARLLRRGRVVWSGGVAELALEPDEPYWILVHGEERTRIINPPDELRWLLAELAKQSGEAGSTDDVPVALWRAMQAEGSGPAA